MAYFSFVDWLIVASGIIGAFYLFATWNYDHFKKRNVNAAKPVVLFGNFGGTIINRISYASLVQNIYNLFPEDKFTGMFDFRKPILMVKDPELILQITTRDFDYFVNHGFDIDENVDPLFGKSLFVLKDQKWRDMRRTLSPAFSRNRMRGMYNMINDCANQVIAYIEKEIENESSILELKDLSTRFSNDVIASSAFGIISNSLIDRDNELYKMGINITKPSIKFTLKLIFLSFPFLTKYLQMTVFDAPTSNYFRTLIENTIAIRKKDNIHRPDMMHLLLQARKGLLQPDVIGSDAEGYAAVPEHLPADNRDVEERDLTDDDITSQAMIFYFDGFDTSSTLMSFAAYEITINEEVQQKLQEEIDAVKEQHKTITYDVIHSLKYLDMVLSETLRKWPPDVAIDRACGKPYTLQDENTSIRLEPDDAIVIPVFALQRDPKYFPDPERFNPERFSPENINNIKPGTYLPFGLGPRNCIASRFVLMEAKAIIFHLVANFNLKVCPKTQIPLKLSKTTFPFTLTAEKDFWIKFEPRTV